MNHSKMLTRRRTKQRHKKELAVAAKRAKKLWNRKQAGADAGKAAPKS